MIRKEAIAVGIISFVSFCAGGGLSYLLTKRHLEEKLDAEYNQKMEEEIARTKDFYRRVQNKEDLETTAFKAGLGEAADALKSYQTVDTGTIFAEQAVLKKADYRNVTVKSEDLEDPGTPIEKNIFDDGDQLIIHKEDRDTDKPYVIDIVEYLDTPEGFEQIELTYYAGDNTLGDDKDEPVPDYNVDMLVGRANLLLFGASNPDQPHVLLVRNEKIRTDFEITHSEGHFSHEVAGLDLKHSDETFQRTRPRPRREE